MDVEGEDSRRRKPRGASRNHWRSVSWTGGRGGCLDDPTLCSDKGLQISPRIQAADEGTLAAEPSCNDATAVAEDGSHGSPSHTPNTPQLVLCPPLQSLSVSRQTGGAPDAGEGVGVGGVGGGGIGRRFMRSAIDIKLDLGSMQEYSNEGDDEAVQKKERLTQCDKQCSRVLAHIYFGGSTVAQNFDILHACKITHILNCVGYVCPEYFPEDFHYKTLWLQDHPGEDILCLLYNVFDYFEEVREQGGRVFVHCIQGVSRSASLVIAYLIWRERRPYEEVFDMVKAVRCVISPNVGFTFQLLQWQSRILDLTVSAAADHHPLSFLRMYRMAPYSLFDPLHLVPKWVATPTATSLDSRGAFVMQLPQGVFIWRGKQCMNLLAAAADKAAFQFIHYEHASGPIVSVREGGELPPAIHHILRNNEVADSGSSHMHTSCQPVALDGGKCQAATAVDDGGCYLGSGFELRNADYDADFELLQQVQAGVWRGPMLKGGQLPARDGNWSAHRSNNNIGSKHKFEG